LSALMLFITYVTPHTLQTIFGRLERTLSKEPVQILAFLFICVNKKPHPKMGCIVGQIRCRFSLTR
jgi:hypothetical protein